MADRGVGGFWRDNKVSLAAAVLGLAVGASVMAFAGQGGGGGDRSQIEGIVREYILANPEILPEAMERLQQRDAARVVDQNRAALETPFHGAWAGAQDGDVVLVEFFDYACGFCRSSNPDVERLLREDDRLKVVWRELPVLGPDSEAAARASLAAARQGRFTQFYERLFALGRPSASNVAGALQAAGVGASVPEAEARGEIQKNMQLAQAIGATGTPTFVVGDKVLEGAVGYEALKAAIDAARARS